MPRSLVPLNLLRLLNLHNDQAVPEVIDSTIRDGTKVGGTNLWVLMFAIIIASVGLNVNSTAVIIGAMLISPLMGPIIGIGYGAGIQDSLLIRLSLRNLAVFVGISLLTSSLYFFVTPLTMANSELLARTSPTIWDVLIAFFGGAAGMIGLTRKEKSTLIPGVAIATALMPPLCTAGFGLATGQFQYFLGAFYLFLINSVFIAFATLTITRILRLPQYVFADESERRRGRLLITAAVSITLLPSIFLAYWLVQEEIFVTASNRFIASLATSEPDLALIGQDVDAKTRVIQLTIIGAGVKPELQGLLESRLAEYGLPETQLKIRHPSEARQEIDLLKLKREVQQDVLRNVVSSNDAKSVRIAELEARLAHMTGNVGDLRSLEVEIRAQLPQVRKVIAAASGADIADATGVKYQATVFLDSPTRIAGPEVARLKRWLAVRLPSTEVSLIIGKALGNSSDKP